MGSAHIRYQVSIRSALTLFCVPRSQHLHLLSQQRVLLVCYSMLSDSSPPKKLNTRNMAKRKRNDVVCVTRWNYATEKSFLGHFQAQDSQYHTNQTPHSCLQKSVGGAPFVVQFTNIVKDEGATCRLSCLWVMTRQ